MLFSITELYLTVVESGLLACDAPYVDANSFSVSRSAELILKILKECML